MPFRTLTPLFLLNYFTGTIILIRSLNVHSWKEQGRFAQAVVQALGRVYSHEKCDYAKMSGNRFGRIKSTEFRASSFRIASHINLL